MVYPHDKLVWISDVEVDDAPYVGKEVAELGRLAHLDLPIVTGFVITPYAYTQFLKENKLDIKINHLLNVVDYNHTESITQVSMHIRKLIMQAPISSDLAKHIFSAYKHMGGIFSSPAVTIYAFHRLRNQKNANHGGHYELYSFVKGESVVIEMIRKAWASAFEAKALVHRHRRGEGNAKLDVAVLVQKVVNPEVSGMMMTADPQMKNTMVIEAVYGAKDFIWQAGITPDQYKVQKKDFALLEKKISTQEIMLIRQKNSSKEKKIDLKNAKKQKISDVMIAQLANMGKKIEEQYFFSQEVEWIYEKKKIYITRVRPVTYKEKPKEEKKVQVAPFAASAPRLPLVVAAPLTPGIGTGIARFVKSVKEIKKAERGDVLIVPDLDKALLPALKKASGVIVERNVKSTHVPIAFSGLGIPIISGAFHEVKRIKEGEVITVNGKTGEVLKGSYLIHPKKEAEIQPILPTKTKVYVHLNDLAHAQTIADRYVDGVGILEADTLIAKMGVHPKKYIEEKKEKLFMKELQSQIQSVCKAFYPRPVFYKTSSFKSNQYRQLRGGKDFEVIEENPLLGYRGAFRAIADPTAFQLELAAIKQLREKEKINNLHIVIPFVRTIKELRQMKKMIAAAGLRRSATHKHIMMVGLPSNVMLIEQYIDEGLDGVYLDLDMLAMLTLALDKDNEEVGLACDVKNEAVVWAVERVLKACKKKGVSVTVGSESIATDAVFIKQLIEWGASSIVTDEGAIEVVRDIIYKTEGKK